MNFADFIKLNSECMSPRRAITTTGVLYFPMYQNPTILLRTFGIPTTYCGIDLGTIYPFSFL